MSYVFRVGPALGLALIMTSLSACMIHDVDTEPSPPAEVPDQWSAGDPGDGPLPERYWESLGDPTLNNLVDIALADNLDLRASWARLEQAMAAGGIAESGLYPTITASAGVGGQGSPFREDPDPIKVSVAGQDLEFPVSSGPKNSASYSLTVSAGYEVDLWGRVRSSIAAGEHRIASSSEDVQTAAMSIAGAVTDVWMSLIEQRSRRELLAIQLKSNRTMIELARLRFQQGLASSLDVYQQELQIAAIETQLPLIDQGEALLRHQLNLLMGRSPSAALPEIAMTLPASPALPGLGVPADLLQRRPDVRAAHHRVLAADYRLGVAIADQFPALRLSASTGFQATDMANFFTGFLWSLAANLLAPIFDGGRRAAEAERNRWVVEESLAGYGRAVLIAMREVEDALVRDRTHVDYLGRLDKQISIAQKTLSEATARYMQGLSTFLPVLSAQVSVQSLQQGRVSAERQVLANRVTLMRSLGGTWTQKLKRPKRLRGDDEPNESEEVEAQGSGSEPESGDAR